MPLRIRLYFTSLSLMLFVIAAVPLVQNLAGRSDIWWTPRTMLVPLAESGQRAEIYVRGGPLAAQLTAGRLRIEEEGRSSVLTASDVGLRFNNWDQVRIQRLPLLLACAAACGLTACLFLLIVTGRLAYRPESPAP